MKRGKRKEEGKDETIEKMDGKRREKERERDENRRGRRRRERQVGMPNHGPRVALGPCNYRTTCTGLVTVYGVL